MEERFGATHPDALKLRFHTQTAGSTLTAQQPHNNVVRVALQALAAVLGGTQSLHTNSMDEALSLPTQEAVQIALRTQQILAEESGVANSIDPLGGSYLVEELTDEIESRARDYLDEIDRQGGALPAIESGYIQGEIQDAAYRQLRDLESGESHQVGVNIYQMDEELFGPALCGPGAGKSPERTIGGITPKQGSKKCGSTHNPFEIGSEQHRESNASAGRMC